MNDSFAPQVKNDIWDVVIIGSGPSSLTAAIYTTRGARSSLILGGEKWGGQLMLTSTVDNFPGFPDGILGPDLMMAMRKQAERFGGIFKEETVINVNLKKTPFEVTTSEGTYKAKTVLIATGADTVWLNVEGESELIGRGVSSCAPCDAPFFREKKVAVVGGGDSAMEEALVLSKYAKEVVIIHRRNEFRASKAMQQKVFENKKISVIWNSVVTKVVGQMKLEKLIVKNIETNKEEEQNFDGVFVAIGHTPSTSIFKDQLELDNNGFIVKKTIQIEGALGQFTMMTSINGVFVAGDVHDHHYKQAITAAGFGCMAGMEILNYLDSVNSSNTQS